MSYRIFGRIAPFPLLCGALFLFCGFGVFAIEDLGAPKSGSPLVCDASPQPVSDSNEAARLVVEGWRHRVWSLYPVEKVKAAETLSVQVKGEGVSIEAARGEAEPFVLVLRSEAPLRNVTVSCTELMAEGQASIRAEAVGVKRMAYVYVDEPSGTRMKATMPYATGVGGYPDPLFNGAGDARPNRNLQFLVTVLVPREARPGSYRGSLKLEYTREAWMPADKPNAEVIPLEVRVRSFALPEVSPLLNTSVFSLKRLPEWLQKDAVLE
ncbi:MAG: hypothetical protein WCL08_09475, partial [Verrucomicrobiota bacterium]